MQGGQLVPYPPCAVPPMPPRCPRCPRVERVGASRGNYPLRQARNQMTAITVQDVRGALPRFRSLTRTQPTSTARLWSLLTSGPRPRPAGAAVRARSAPRATLKQSSAWAAKSRASATDDATAGNVRIQTPAGCLVSTSGGSAPRAAAAGFELWSASSESCDAIQRPQVALSAIRPRPRPRLSSVPGQRPRGSSRHRNSAES